MKIKKFLKTIAIIIATLIAIIIVGFGYFFVQDFKTEDNLKKEFQEINNMINEKNINIEEVNNRLKRTISSGDYEIVENWSF